MICCEVSGGLGNQLFRYAFARTLQEKRKKQGVHDKIAVNYVRVDNHGFVGSLSDLTIGEHESYNCRRLLLEKGFWWQILIYAIITRIGRLIKILHLKYWLLGKIGIVISENPDDETLYNPPIKIKNIFAIGNFENEKYFYSIKNQLLKEFTPRYKEREENKDLYEVIRSKNSICLAVRRGDFLTVENKNTFYVCDLEYFKKAVEYMQAHVENPIFIVFSNEIEWVKNNLKINGEVFYESGKDPVWETFRLMYSCKHFIISNSTMHWWAQYKGCYPEKIVIAPSRWYNVKGWENHLMMDYFVRISPGI